METVDQGQTGALACSGLRKAAGLGVGLCWRVEKPGELISQPAPGAKVSLTLAVILAIRREMSFPDEVWERGEGEGQLW